MVPTPTDSLYKFVALSGLAVVLISLYYPAEQVRELQIQQIDIEASVANIEYENLILKQKAAFLEKQIDQADDDEVSRDLHEERYQAELALNQKLNTAKASTEKLKILRSDCELYVALSWARLLIGLAMSIIGFCLWYFRVQRHLDQKLRNEATRKVT